MRPEDARAWRASERRREEELLALEAAKKKKKLEEASPGETRPPSTDERPQGSALDPGF